MTGAAYLADVSRTIGTKSIDMGGTVHENSDLEKLQGISGLSAQAGEFKLVSKGRQVSDEQFVNRYGSFMLVLLWTRGMHAV
jgi:hypothetical protein